MGNKEILRRNIIRYCKKIIAFEETIPRKKGE